MQFLCRGLRERNNVIHQIVEGDGLRPGDIHDFICRFPSYCRNNRGDKVVDMDGMDEVISGSGDKHEPSLCCFDKVGNKALYVTFSVHNAGAENRVGSCAFFKDPLRIKLARDVLVP